MRERVRAPGCRSDVWVGLRGELLAGRGRAGPREVALVPARPSGGESRSVSRVSVERDAVDHERVAEEVDVLAGMVEAVRSSESVTGALDT